MDSEGKNGQRNALKYAGTSLSPHALSGEYSGLNADAPTWDSEAANP
jgi:hypothetical protein